MAYPILPITAFIGAALVLIPVPSHWRARNYATVSLVTWLFILDVIYGVNSVVWSDNARIRLLVWCDITTKLTIGASVALPAAAMCICKHLELVASGRVVRASHGDKKRRMFFDLAMCFLLPAIIMALHYVVQGHRFDIVEAFGCQPATYYSIPGVFIVWFPPLLLAFVSMIYASLALYHFLRHRVTFAAVLRNSNSSITPNRYLRLMALAITEIIWQIVLTVLPMYDNISLGLRPWTTWADVHSDWLRIDQYYLAEFEPSYKKQLFLFFFAIPASCLLFFFFFGFGEQAISDYRQLFVRIRRKILRQKNVTPKIPNNGIMPKGNLATHCAYSIPHFVAAGDDNSLPAYSPPSDRAMFQSSVKKDFTDLSFSDGSLHDVALSTFESGELSPTDTESSSSSLECAPATPRTIYHDVDEQFAGAPIVPGQRALVSPTSPRAPGCLPVPPRAPEQVSRFVPDSDVADMV